MRTADGDLIGREGVTSIYGGGGYAEDFIESVLVTPIPAECTSNRFFLVKEPEQA